LDRQARSVPERHFVLKGVEVNVARGQLEAHFGAPEFGGELLFPACQIDEPF